MQEGLPSEKDKNTIHAMICLVVNTNNQILILKRAKDKKYFPGKWAPVGAAPLTGEENMKEIAQKELVDELGVEGKIIKEAKPSNLEIQGINWIIHPFLALIETSTVSLNNEHTEYKWIEPKELENYDSIPMFGDIVKHFLK